jgi:hypothetical protein
MRPDRSLLLCILSAIALGACHDHPTSIADTSIGGQYAVEFMPSGSTVPVHVTLDIVTADEHVLHGTSQIVQGALVENGTVDGTFTGNEVTLTLPGTGASFHGERTSEVEISGTLEANLFSGHLSQSLVLEKHGYP